MKNGTRYLVLRQQSSTGNATTDYFRTKPDHMRGAPRCPSCGQYIGLLRWLSPLRVELKLYGAKFGDFAFGGGDDLLVSDLFRRSYMKARLTGLESFDPVEVVKVKTKKKQLQEEPPKYYRVLPALSNAAIDDVRSELVREKPWTCSRCRSNGVVSVKRIVLEDGTWSDEDIFLARGLPATILISSRFADVYASNRLDGAELIPAEDYTYDTNNFSFVSK